MSAVAQIRHDLKALLERYQPLPLLAEVKERYRWAVDVRIYLGERKFLNFCSLSDGQLIISHVEEYLRVLKDAYEFGRREK